MTTSAEDSKTKNPVETLNQQLGDTEQLRIQMGRRIVQGELASGERRSVTTEQAEYISAALQQPVSEGVDAASYQGKVPNIEIRSGEDVLFRQERDGAVTASAFQIEQQSAEATVPAVIVGGDRLAETVVAAENPPVASALEERHAEAKVLTPPEALAQQARGELILAEPAVLTGDMLIENSTDLEAVKIWTTEVVAPLESSEPVAAELGVYTIEVEGNSVTISRDADVVLQAAGGNIEQSNLKAEDAKALTSWLQRDGGFEMWSVPIQQTEAVTEPPKAIAIEVAQAQVEALPDNRAKSFFQKLVTDVSQQAARGIGAVRQGLESDQFKALQNNLTQQVSGAVASMRQGLESEQFKTLQSNVSVGVREAPERTAEAVGKGLERTGQWLASKSEAIRDQKAARGAFQIFEEGFKRTHEKSFEHGGFKVEFEGGNRFRLSSVETGESMMRFSANKSTVPGQGHSFTVLEKSMSREQYGALNVATRSNEPVRGSEAAEAEHYRKSAAIAQLSAAMATAMGSNDYHGKHYRIKVGEASLKISANDGRGEVYRQERGRVESRFEQKDFGHFAPALQKLEARSAAVTATAATTSHTSQIELG